MQSRNPNQGAGGEIANICWNRKVQHILASCTVGGSVTVWDLKKLQPVLNIRDSSGYACHQTCLPADRHMLYLHRRTVLSFCV